MNRKLVQQIAAGAAFAAVAGRVAAQFGNYLFRGNLHTVIPGQVCRSAQPTAESIGRWIESLGLRSVINLKNRRGDALPDAYALAALSGQLDIRYIRLSARRWPSPAEVEQLISHLDTAARPLVIHCQAGTDRSGLASAIALLLEGQGPDRAAEQFSLDFGYPGALLGSDLPSFLVSYREWLDHKGLAHTPGRFRAWVGTDYVAYYYEAELEFAPLPETLPAGQPFSLQIKVTNRSKQPIPLDCAEGEGVRLSLRLRSLEPGGGDLSERRFCNREQSLAPAASIVVTAGSYDLGSPGSYEFAADLVDESREHFFADMGSQITRQTITIR